MNYRYTAVIATVSNSFCDAVLDYAVSRYDYYRVLLWTSFTAFVLQLCWGVVTHISFSVVSLPFVFIHAVLVLAGYICFVRSLVFIPVALVGLIESSSLFLTFMIDAALGYIQVTFYFAAMFLLFVFSVFLFAGDCLTDGRQCFKQLKPVGFFWVLASVLFYVSAPYLVKLSDGAGANETAINLGYYLVAVPYFGRQFLKARSGRNAAMREMARGLRQNFYSLCLLIGILEAVYYVFETFSFINDAPTVVVVIEQMRIFLLFILSVLFKTDSFSLRKTVALCLGVVSVIGVYLN